MYNQLICQSTCANQSINQSNKQLVINKHEIFHLHEDSFEHRIPAISLVGHFKDPMFGKSQRHMESSLPVQASLVTKIFPVSFSDIAYEDIMENLINIFNS
jgi:hypothetical protein